MEKRMVCRNCGAEIKDCPPDCKCESRYRHTLSGMHVCPIRISKKYYVAQPLNIK